MGSTGGIAHRQKEIEQRLRKGEKAAKIARDMKLDYALVIGFAHKAGIRLKKGRSNICAEVSLYRKHIDTKFGPGTATKLLQLRKRLTYADIGQALGGMSRGSAHHIGKYLAGGAPKPVVPHKPVKWQKADITVEKVRESAERCLSVAAMAREFGVDVNLIHRRARHGNIVLPNGRLNWAAAVDQRPDITHEKIQIFAELLPSISAMARELKATTVTIKRRAKRFDVSLPRYRRARLAP